MKELTMFYFDECPHCQNALRWEKELLARRPELAAVPVQRINEKRQPELADTYDYYYVPTYYLGREKLAEGVKDPALLEQVFDRALNA